MVSHVTQDLDWWVLNGIERIPNNGYNYYMYNMIYVAITVEPWWVLNGIAAISPII